MQNLIDENKGDKAANFDIRTAHLGKAGLEPFYWPVGYGEIRGFCLDVLAGCAATARKGREAGQEGTLEFAALSHYLAGEAMAIFQGQALVERCRKSGREPFMPEGFRIWPALAKGRAPSMPPFFDSLMTAFPRRSFKDLLRKRLSKLTGQRSKRKRAEKQAMAQSVACRQGQETFRIHTRRLTRKIFRKEIVTTKRGDIQSQHAAESDVRVTMAAHKFWFPPLTLEAVQRRKGKVLDSRLKAEAIEMLRTLFEHHGVSFPQHVREFFQEYLDSGTAMLACHLDRLRKRPWRLPAHIWTGTCGNVWDRLLRIAVKERGGRAVGHSHAGGFHHRRAPEQNSVEFLACDEFVVYNAAQAKYTVLGTDQQLLLEEMPAVVAVRGDAEVESDGPAGTVQDGPVRKIMYVACNYLGERQAFDPPVHDLVAVDFQARMFQQLRERGYEVLYKPHPESDMPPPERMEQVTGAVRLDENFEAILDLPDLYLFDNTNSTTFKVALKTRKPIVYVDTGTDTWCGEVYEQLGRRCAIVRAYFDSENRIRMDWDELAQAIERAPALAGDLEFVREHVI